MGVPTSSRHVMAQKIGRSTYLKRYALASNLLAKTRNLLHQLRSFFKGFLALFLVWLRFTDFYEANGQPIRIDSL